MLEAAPGTAGRSALIGATHYSPAAFGELAELMASGRIDGRPGGPTTRPSARVERNHLAAGWRARAWGVLLMRPLGEGQLVRRAAPARPS